MTMAKRSRCQSPEDRIPWPLRFEGATACVVRLRMTVPIVS
jgi:hypothetical protein